MCSSDIIDVLNVNNDDKFCKIRVVVVSDTHGNHRMINIPNGDLFLHCGDFTNRRD
jgi:hypothetical protein